MTGAAHVAGVPAVVLRTRPLGEADLVVVLLTAEQGKVATAARNARKSKRRFPGGLPGGAVGRAEVSPGRGSLWRLSAFRAGGDYGVFGRDLDRFAYAAYLCELTDELVLEREPVPRLFAVLVETLVRLREQGARPLELRRYELVLLEVLGLMPALDHCAVCGLEVTAPRRPFEATRGGVLCPAHAGEARGLPAAVLDGARRLLAGPSAWREASADHRKALRDLTYGVLRDHLRRPLRSREFFRKIGGTGA